MKDTELRKAVDWFFQGGYAELARTKGTAKQAQISSAVTSLMRVSELLELTPSEALAITYSGKHNRHRK